MIEINGPIVASAVCGMMAVCLPIGASGQSRGGESRLPPLCEAITADNQERAIRLVKQGADVNAGNGCALMAAASRGQLDMSRLLLDRGANPNRIASGDTTEILGGPTPLVAAVQSRNIHMVRLLLERGADPRGDIEAFDVVLNFSDLEMAELLLRHGANPNMTTPARRRVYAYVERRQVEIPQHDLQADRIDATAKRYQCAISWSSVGSLLYLAVVNGGKGPEGNNPIVRLLLDRGADPNARTINGSTPLMAAAAFHNHRIITMLLDAGADVKAADRCGRTAEDYATLYPPRNVDLPLRTKALLQERLRK